MNAEFIIATNPDPGSTLPFLVYLPIDGGLWLKTKESWPRSTRLYCHLAEPPAAGDLDILERTIPVACVRRGPAIDLVLSRATNKRSQFIFTTYRGRKMVFWQTPKSAAASRPGLRIPFTRAGNDLVFCIDTRERYGYAFKAHGVNLTRRALAVGDYAAEAGGRILAVVERKSLDDFTSSIVGGSLNFAMAELAVMPAAAIVVEGMYSTLLRHQFTRTGFIADLVARLQVRYPNVPIVFAESRKIGEEWTFRFLRAAYANAGSLELSALPGAALTSSRPPKRKRAVRKQGPLAGTSDQD